MDNRLIRYIAYISVVLVSCGAEGASESSMSDSTGTLPNFLVLSSADQRNRTSIQAELSDFSDANVDDRGCSMSFEVSDFDGTTPNNKGSSVHVVTNLEEIELDLTIALTADDLMPYIPLSRNVSKGERRTHIEDVLQRAQSRGGRSGTHLFELQNFIAQQKNTRNIGLPITVSEDHIRPALEWLGKKVLKKDLELVNTKFDRQKLISVMSGAGAFVISSGLACLTAYLGSLYK